MAGPPVNGFPFTCPPKEQEQELTCKGRDPAKSVGKFLVAALRHPETSFGKALKVQSFVVTPNQVLAEYEKQTGGAKWKVTKTPLEEYRKREQKLWEEGDFLATLTTLRRIWAEGGTLYDKNDNELLEMGEADLDSLEVAVKRTLGGQ